MSKVRTVYQLIEDSTYKKKVILVEPSNSNVVIETGQNYIVGEPEEVSGMLSGMGIDFSLLWEDSIINRFSPIDEDELDISSHPIETDIRRKISVHSMPINQTLKFFWINLIIRHFDESGNHLIQPYDDKMYCSRIDNSHKIDGVGEFDYFRHLADSGASIFDLQKSNIPSLDINGNLGVRLY